MVHRPPQESGRAWSETRQRRHPSTVARSTISSTAKRAAGSRASRSPCQPSDDVRHPDQRGRRGESGQAGAVRHCSHARADRFTKPLKRCCPGGPGHARPRESRAKKVVGLRKARRRKQFLQALAAKSGWRRPFFGRAVPGLFLVSCPCSVATPLARRRRLCGPVRAGFRPHHVTLV